MVLMTIASANKFFGFVSLPIWIAAEAEFQKELSALEKTNWGFGVSKKATQVFQHNLRTKQNQHPQNRIFPHRFHSIQKRFLSWQQRWWRISLNWRAKHRGKKYIKWKWKLWNHANLIVECLFQLYGGTSINNYLIWSIDFKSTSWVRGKGFRMQHCILITIWPHLSFELTIWKSLYIHASDIGTNVSEI